jgi:hypothetical protein
LRTSAHGTEKTDARLFFPQSRPPNGITAVQEFTWRHGTPKSWEAVFTIEEVFEIFREYPFYMLNDITVLLIHVPAPEWPEHGFWDPDWQAIGLMPLNILEPNEFNRAVLNIYQPNYLNCAERQRFLQRYRQDQIRVTIPHEIGHVIFDWLPHPILRLYQDTLRPFCAFSQFSEVFAKAFADYWWLRKTRDWEPYLLTPKTRFFQRLEQGLRAAESRSELSMALSSILEQAQTQKRQRAIQLAHQYSGISQARIKEWLTE